MCGVIPVEKKFTNHMLVVPFLIGATCYDGGGDGGRRVSTVQTSPIHTNKFLNCLVPPKLPPSKFT